MRTLIRTEQVPFIGAGAFAPMTFVTPAASSGGLVRTTGNPAAVVPAPPPGVVNVGLDPLTNPSACAPNFIRPSQYVSHVDNMYPPVPIAIDNVMPVPVTNIVRVPKQSTHKQRIGGRTATSWPRNLIRWPTIGGGSA